MSQDDDQSNIPSSDSGQDTSSTADEIGEQVMGSYFAKAWGARPANAPPVELNEFKQLHQSPNTMYVSGLVKIADITEALTSRLEQAEQLPRAKIPPEVLKRRDEVRELAVKVLGSHRYAEYWLERPVKYNLDDRRPAELLQTLEGCDKVEELLKSLYP